MITEKLIMKEVEGIIVGVSECFNTPFALIYQINFQEDTKLAFFKRIFEMGAT